jgi:hypothetical protein
MFMAEPLPFVKEFVEELSDGLEQSEPGSGLTPIPKHWLAFCLIGIALTNSVCWAKFARAGLGHYSVSALSWVFRQAKIPWESLLSISVRLLLRKYGLRGGYLIADDSDKKRAKVTQRIFRSHKVKDKKSGGYLNGQTIIVLLLVTPLVTIPVGVSFYQPDPAWRAWHKKEQELKRAGVAKRNRPPKPERNPLYPTKPEIVLTLLAQFKYRHAEIQVRVILTDGLYASGDFLDRASEIFGGIQVISRLQRDQNVRFRNRTLSLEKYFASYGGVEQQIKIRGEKEVTACVGSARLYLAAHQEKRFVVALKYEGEAESRYLVASDLSWRTLDIVQAYTLRWLVEVFFEDWKLYEGWGQLAKQPDAEGSSRSLILSLLLDHCLLVHPEQLARLENKLPAVTVGSLLQKIKVDALLAFIRELLASGNAEEKLEVLRQTVAESFQLAPSKKHMVNRDLGRSEPSPSLIYRAQIAMRTV